MCRKSTIDGCCTRYNVQQRRNRAIFDRPLAGDNNFDRREIDRSGRDNLLIENRRSRLSVNAAVISGRHLVMRSSAHCFCIIVNLKQHDANRNSFKGTLLQ
jgi:hypothetical protein